MITVHIFFIVKQFTVIMILLEHNFVITKLSKFIFRHYFFNNNLTQRNFFYNSFSFSLLFVIVPFFAYGQKQIKNILRHVCIFKIHNSKFLAVITIIAIGYLL
jgi:hypothetical protein